MHKRYHTHHECYCPEKNCNQQTGCVLIDHSKIVLRINGFAVHSSRGVENLQEELDEHGWDWCAYSNVQRTRTKFSSVLFLSHVFPIKFYTYKDRNTILHVVFIRWMQIMQSIEIYYWDVTAYSWSQDTSLHIGASWSMLLLFCRNIFMYKICLLSVFF